MKRPEHAGIVIVGGGGPAAGRQDAARSRLQRPADGCQRRTLRFYERPPLSKAALLDAAAPLSRLFSEQTVAELNIDWRRPLRAESIDAEQQIVTLSDGQRLQFEQLLIATGGRPRVPSAARAQHPRVMTLRSGTMRPGCGRACRAAVARRSSAAVGSGWRSPLPRAVSASR